MNVMTKADFVARMLEDAHKREQEEYERRQVERERERRAQSDLADYIGMRREQVSRYYRRKERK